MGEQKATWYAMLTDWNTHQQQCLWHASNCAIELPFHRMKIEFGGINFQYFYDTKCIVELQGRKKCLRRVWAEHNLKIDFYLYLSFRQPFARYVETGRVAKATSGPLRGKILTIVDCIDQTRVSKPHHGGEMSDFFPFFCDDPYINIGIAD